MSTGRHDTVGSDAWGGFTAVELLLGVVLTVTLALGLAPVVSTIDQMGTLEADRSVRLIQSRVAVARLERDLRMATAGGCSFAVEGAILEATPSQVVFLARRVGVEGLSIVEWEIVGPSLMRRWGPCPSEMPDSFLNSVYVDNKTMLEGLGGDASFTFVVGGVVRGDKVQEADLCRVSSVTLQGAGEDASGKWSPLVDCDARVGR